MPAPRNTPPPWRFGQASRLRLRRHALLLQGMVAAAPWLNLLFICGLLLFIGRRFLIQPAAHFELPPAEIRESALMMMPTALLLPLEDAPADGALLFYDDLRYHAGHPAELARFTETLTHSVKLEGLRELMLLADRRVPHQWVMAVAQAAHKSGVQRINVGTRSDIRAEVR